MKVKLNVGKLRQQMRLHGVKSYKQLAEVCGFSFYTFQDNKNRREIINQEHLWLVSDYFGCNMSDLVYPDWDD